MTVVDRRFVAVFFVAAVSFALLVFVLQSQDRADTEQYAAYSAYVESGLTGESHSLGDRRGTVLIAAEATIGRELNMIQRWRHSLGAALNLRRRTDPPRSSLIWELFLANLRTHRLHRRFTFAADYQLLDLAELSLPQINQRFPRSYGYLTFSSIAFNSDLTDALFYTEHLCGLCGGGEFVFMQKIQGRWIVVNRYSTWVS